MWFIHFFMRVCSRLYTIYFSGSLHIAVIRRAFNNVTSCFCPCDLIYQATDSECEDEPIKHSFVNHYMSDPSYFNSWKRQQKGLKETLACAYEECASGDGEGYYQTVVTQHSMGGVYTPTGQPAPGSRTPLTGFSSFV